MKHLPTTQEDLIQGMILQHVNHQIAINQLEEQGYEMPEPCSMIQHALSIKDGITPKTIKRVEKVAKKEISKIQLVTARSIERCVNRIMEEI